MIFDKKSLKKYSVVIFLPILLIFVLFLIEKATQNKTSLRSQMLGKSLDNLELIDLETKDKISLSKFKGKVLLINFWATWCEACVSEMPSIVKLYNTLKPQGFEVISINVDEQPSKVVPQAVNKLGMNFKIFLDLEQKFAETFNVVAIPYSIVVGRDLKVAWSESGERDWASEEIFAELRRLIEKSI